MSSARVYKRFFAYLTDKLACLCLSFSLLSFIYILYSDLWWAYLIAGVVLGYIIYAFGMAFVFKICNGKSLGYFIFGLKIIQKGQKKFDYCQILMKTSIEGFFVLECIECIFICSNKTEVGALERLNNTFIIDER